MVEGDWQRVYATLYGVCAAGEEVSGVENAFESGKICGQRYCRMLRAYERLHCKLEALGEDTDDLEIMLNALSEIEKELCRKMFAYGMRFGAENI